jgi:hypothetical protein
MNRGVEVNCTLSYISSTAGHVIWCTTPLIEFFYALADQTRFCFWLLYTIIQRPVAFVQEFQKSQFTRNHLITSTLVHFSSPLDRPAQEAEVAIPIRPRTEYAGTRSILVLGHLSKSLHRLHLCPRARYQPS